MLLAVLRKDKLTCLKKNWRKFTWEETLLPVRRISSSRWRRHSGA